MIRQPCPFLRRTLERMGFADLGQHAIELGPLAFGARRHFLLVEQLLAGNCDRLGDGSIKAFSQATGGLLGSGIGYGYHL